MVCRGGLGKRLGTDASWEETKKLDRGVIEESEGGIPEANRASDFAMGRTACRKSIRPKN